MDSYKDQDTLYDFIKSIKSVGEFFIRKRPSENDEQMLKFVSQMRDMGQSEESILYALKSQERQNYAKEVESLPGTSNDNPRW